MVLPPAVVLCWKMNESKILVVNIGMLMYEKCTSCIFLTEVLITPQVADGHISKQKHGDTTNASLLYIDVLVVVPVIGWKRTVES